MRAFPLVLLLGLLAPARAYACGKAELRTFVAYAQSLDPRADAEGRKLLGCPGETAEAAQWLAFYRAVSKDAPKTPLPKAAVAKADAPGEVGKAVSAAYGGNLAPLRKGLDSGNPSFTQSADVHLALGRLLAREGKLADARREYEDALRLKADAPAEEAEYLYLSVWEGDLARADRDFAARPATGELAPAIARGRALVAKLRPAEAKPAAAAAGPARPVGFAGTVEAFALKDELRRYTGEAAYTGVVDADWRHHTIHGELLDEPSLNADELRLGRTQKLGESGAAAAHVGYMTQGSKHWLGDAAFRLGLPRSVWLGAGADRRALYTEVPLAKDALALTQDRGWLEGGWGELVAVRTATLQDDGQAPFERHEVRLRQPLPRRSDDGTSLAAVGQLSYEARARPSPDYETYRRTHRIALGGAWARKTGGALDASADVLYVLLQRQPHGGSKYLRHSGVDVQLELGSALDERMRLVGKLRLAAQETDRPAQKVEQSVSFVAGLELTE